MAGKSVPMFVRLARNAKQDMRSGCLNWTGFRNPDGYGEMNISRKTSRAHRVAYECHVGPIPDGLQVCHSCDNRACINPKHLFLGTNADNMADKMVKGRHGYSGGARGVSHPHAKLTNADVAAIRAASGISQRELAARFGVSQVNICFIRQGRMWKHL